MKSKTPSTRDEKLAAQKEDAGNYKKLVIEMKKLESKYGYRQIQKWSARRQQKMTLIGQKEDIESRIKNVAD
jgi:hypothetical protein